MKPTLARLYRLDILWVFFTFVIAHLYFVNQLRHEVTIVAIIGLIISLFKSSNRNFILIRILSLFFISFQIVRSPWPFLGFIPWPLDLYLASFLIYFALRFFKMLPEKINWELKLTRGMMFSLILIVVPSLVCLVGYFYYHPEVAKQFPYLDVPAWTMPLIILLIALVNGFREEIYFRFLLQNSLNGVFSYPTGIIISAILFGFIHFQAGFPQGYLGVFLTSLFGLLVGLQYFFYKSAILTGLTHAVTDAVMFSIILLSR